MAASTAGASSRLRADAGGLIRCWGARRVQWRSDQAAEPSDARGGTRRADRSVLDSKRKIKIVSFVSGCNNEKDPTSYQDRLRTATGEDLNLSDSSRF